jgi:hypothetical protein
MFLGFKKRKERDKESPYFFQIKKSTFTSDFEDRDGYKP